MNDRERWLAERRTGIGGSDAAAVLGLSPWRTAFQVYLEKRGGVESYPDNEAMLWGRVLEPVIRQQYVERTGRLVRTTGGIIRHPKHPFMLANLDGITDDRRVVEVKTARTAQDWGEPGTDEIPLVYIIQVQHYMAVTGFPIADVAALIGGADFRLYEVPEDRELQSLIIEQEAEFWKRVQSGNPPDPVSYADVQARYGRASRESAVQATDECIEAISRLAAINVEAALLAEEEEKLKALVMKAMGENDTLMLHDRVLATWKAAKPAERFDAPAFKTAHPQLYSQFLTTSKPIRRFLLKDKS